MKIGYHLMVVMLLGALAASSAQAEEAAAAANETSAATSSAKASGSNQGFGQGAAGAAGGGANSAMHGPAEISAGPKGDGSAEVKGAIFHGTPAGGKDSGINPIDTRITVQSRRPTKKSDKIGGDVQTIVRPGAPANFGTQHRTSAPGAIGDIARDAIGHPVANRVDAQGPNALARQESPSAAQISGPGAIGGSARNAVGSFANPGAVVGGPKVAPQGPIAAATAMNRSIISGTGLTRPGYGPAVVGGPAKAVAGINGSGFRPKR